MFYYIWKLSSWIFRRKITQGPQLYPDEECLLTWKTFTLEVPGPFLFAQQLCSSLSASGSLGRRWGQKEALVHSLTWCICWGSLTHFNTEYQSQPTQKQEIYRFFFPSLFEKQNSPNAPQTSLIFNICPVPIVILLRAVSLTPYMTCRAVGQLAEIREGWEDLLRHTTRCP